MARIPSANPYTFAPSAGEYSPYGDMRFQQQRIADSKRAPDFWKKAATAAVIGIGTAGVGSAFLGGGAAAGGAASAAAPTLPAAATAGVVAPSVASGAGMSIPWWSVASKGVDTLSGIYANRQNSKANREAMSVQERYNAEAMAFEREQMAEARRQFDAQQAAAKAALDASNKFEADKWAASEEERLYDRRLRDERETRRAPYREASAAALGRIPGILAGGRTSPGLASLGSYRRG